MLIALIVCIFTLYLIEGKIREKKARDRKNKIGCLVDEGKGEGKKNGWKNLGK